MVKAVSIAALLALCAASSMGQVRGSYAQHAPVVHPGSIGFAPQGRRPLIGVTGPSFRERFHHRRVTPFFYGGWPYWPLGYDDGYEMTTAPEPAEPQPAPSPQLKPEPPLEPALYELRANQWVRVKFGDNTATSAAPISTPGAQAAAKELPPAILVYRDGHTEELTSYSIIGTTIYTKADYWTSGSWTRKIRIADLDVPATVKRNHERGVSFELPSSPNEVILRP